ncbi:hypothetical protein ACFL3V_01410 [Nanoarchaeota archaeon]
MSEKDVVITYETLFELLRIEKNREDLQKLDATFFKDVLEYLNEKKSSFENTESQNTLFAADEKEKSRLEFENIKRILKELYDRREKKIINVALSKARTGVTLVNTANMLPSEKLLFDSASTVLSEFRQNILFKLACCELPEMDSLHDNLLSKLRSSKTDMMPDKPPCDEPQTGPETASQSLEQPKELKTTLDSTEKQENTKQVRFLTAIGEIVGPDLQIYGPFDEGAVISLPNELVSVLLDKKQAEELIN